MPELPEAQTVVNGLRPKITGRRVTGVWFDVPRMIKMPSPERLRKRIKGLVITDVRRRGKYIAIDLTNNLQFPPKADPPLAETTHNFTLLIHQKMTGHLLYGQWGVKKVSSYKFQVESLQGGPLTERVNSYIHFILYLDNGRQVALSDVRKFATIRFGGREEIERSLAAERIGPEPLDRGFTIQDFAKSLAGRRPVKTLLLDQKVVAGLGNIYSSEALFLAGIHPGRAGKSLKKAEIERLFRAIKVVLRRGIAFGGASMVNFRHPTGKEGRYGKHRLVYRREGEGCKHCGGPIRKVTMGGRSSYFCPKCQK